MPKLSTEVPTLIHNFIVQIASEPDFAHFVLNRFEPESEPVRGSAIFLAKILSLFGATQKENNEHLVKIWFLDAGVLLKIKFLNFIIFNIKSIFTFESLLIRHLAPLNVEFVDSACIDHLEIATLYVSIRRTPGT